MSNLPTYYISTGHTPLQKSSIEKLLGNSLYNLLLLLKMYFLCKLYRGIPDLVIGAGSDIDRFFRCVKRVQVADPLYTYVPTDEKTFSKSLPKKFVVYIDQGWAFHPDFTSTQNSICDDPGLWHEAQNRFLADLENHLELPIIVAKHPACSYPADLFKQRQCISGATLDLIALSESVIGHFSTSIGFAVKLYKPILLLTNSQKYPCGVNISGSVKAFHESLKCSIYTINSREKMPKPSVNRRHFVDYIDKYLATSRSSLSMPSDIPSILYNKI